ncbi:MAG TPA: hypothetical protein VHL56_03465, partial [Candidatus Limnocylindrales bacterium]|nr:hypothetical protein [Candidatus Limnocylindrales bacterium]
PRAIAIAVVVGVGVLLLLRELLSLTDDDADRDAQAGADGRGPTWFGINASNRWVRVGVIAVLTTAVFLAVSAILKDTDGFHLKGIPVEPIALFVLIALSPVAAYVATARDARRFVLGALVAMLFWFVLWYPNISALPLPSALHNAYQGFLPSYLYPFQFWVNTDERAAAPPLLALGPGVLLAVLTFTSVVIAYSAWSWRIALAERRRDLLAGGDDAQAGVGGA